MEKVDIIAEQTAFLIDKQKEVLEAFQSEFKLLDDLLETEREKAEKTNAGEELASFQNVAALIDLQKQDSLSQLEDDVEFLNEQMAAIKQIQAMDSSEEREEIVKMMIEGGADIIDTKLFMEEVAHEADEAKQGFANMVSDIKAVLIEDGVKELEMLLEAHEVAKQQEAEAVNCDEMNEDENCECEEEPECKSSCSSCSGCDIFKGLQSELDEKSEEKKTISSV